MRRRAPRVAGRHTGRAQSRLRAHCLIEITTTQTQSLEPLGAKLVTTARCGEAVQAAFIDLVHGRCLSVALAHGGFGAIAVRGGGGALLLREAAMVRETVRPRSLVSVAMSSSPGADMWARC